MEKIKGIGAAGDYGIYIQYRVIEKNKGIFENDYVEKFRELTRDLPIATCKISPPKIGIGLLPDKESIKNMAGFISDTAMQNKQWDSISDEIIQLLIESNLWEENEDNILNLIAIKITKLKEEGNFGNDIEKINLLYS